MIGDTSLVIGEVVRYLFSLYLGLYFLCSCSWFHVLNRIDNWNVIVDWALKNNNYLSPQNAKWWKPAGEPVLTHSFSCIVLLSQKYFCPVRGSESQYSLIKHITPKTLSMYVITRSSLQQLYLEFFYDCVQIFTSTPLTVPARPKSTSSRPSLMSF